MGRQLDRLMPFWQPANILHYVLIFMLLWQINIVVVDAALTTLSEQERAVRALLTSMTVGITSALQGSSASYL